MSEPPVVSGVMEGAAREAELWNVAAGISVPTEADILSMYAQSTTPLNRGARSE